MENAMILPEIRKIQPLPLSFPAAWQAVLFRNYGLVPLSRLGRILKAEESELEREAERLGLGGIGYDPDWLTRGTATIVRENWHLLDYTQLEILLDCTGEELAQSLREDDFLDVKLGGFKPDVEAPVYRPLTEEELIRTEQIGAFVRENRLGAQAKRFRFYDGNEVETCVAGQAGGERIVYSYAAPYGDFLLSGDLSGFPDEMLRGLQHSGVNGIWIQGVLAKLSPHPYAERLSQGYQLRRDNLNKLIRKLKTYGIRLYLYLNEPRSLPESQLPEGLRGHAQGGFAAMCSSKSETWDYLYRAALDLFESVPELGGVITITMSENLSHCKSKFSCNCERCKNEQAELFAARVNNTILQAVKDSGNGAEVIANLWGWNGFMGWTQEQTLAGIDALDQDIAVMCVSETALRIVKGGVENTVIDYTVSSGKESELTKICFERAKQKGHRILAKIQVNNSWECSAVPFIPVFDLIAEHMGELREDGAGGYMLSWTLGGYPSLSLSLAGEIAADPHFSLEEWYECKFSSQAGEVRRAVGLMCAGFREFPFDLGLIYLGPLQMGPGNPWYLGETGLQATMVGYPYDDTESWRGKYPPEIFAGQLQKVVEGFAGGTALLEKCERSPAVAEVLRMAAACRIHFESSLLQFRFNRLKKTDTCSLHPLIKREAELTRELYALIREDPRIGFEASNHYYYYENSLLEKLINLKQIEGVLE